MYKYIKNKELKLNENRFIAVAGNVGAGKSTLTKLVGEKLGFKTHYESVDTNPYLEDFYKDQSKWGFHLQLYFLSQRFKQQHLITNNGFNNIQDRSIYEDVEIFAKNLYDSGVMSEKDYNTYRELFHNMVSHLKSPDLLIYLDGSIESIIDRIDKRGREMEKLVNHSYWENIHKRYDNFISKYDKSNILVVNIDEVDLLENEKQLDELCNEIKKILKLKN